MAKIIAIVWNEMFKELSMGRRANPGVSFAKSSNTLIRCNSSEFQQIIAISCQSSMTILAFCFALLDSASGSDCQESKSW